MFGGTVGMTNQRKINAAQTLIGKMPYTNTTWRQCVIWTRNERGVVETRADVIGACGVHPVVCGGATKYYLWHVSHIPTGRVILARACECDARVVAESLADIPGMNSASLGRVRALVAEVIGE